MRASGAQVKQTAESRAGLHDHLSGCFQERCRRYRKALKHCRKTFVPESVHQLRVESRRLLAFLSLLRILINDASLSILERTLKRLFKNTSRLRDTQVHQLFLRSRCIKHLDLADFEQYLCRREKRLVRRLKKKIKEQDRVDWDQLLAVSRKCLRSFLADPDIEVQHWNVVQQGVDRAFLRVIRRLRQIRANEPLTIHRLRIEFKKFRYLVECLHPLLPGITRHHLNRMHARQTEMGKIQDLEVLLRSASKFLEKSHLENHPFPDVLKRRQIRRITVFMSTTDRLSDFWPPNPGKR